MGKKYFIFVAVITFALALPDISWTSQELSKHSHAPFHLAKSGCPMAHCDPQMTDNANAAVPINENTTILWHDTEPCGSRIGLGCSSNGHIAACTYTNPLPTDTCNKDYLVVYGSKGERLWTSGNLLGPSAWASAPMIDKNGGVIVVDSENLIRFDRKGDVIWKIETPGGTPISPVITESGIIFLATHGGPISAYRSNDGSLIGQLWIKESPEDTAYFQTINTPCVKGDRLYISTEKTDDSTVGRLVAVDIDLDNENEPLCIQWHFPFNGPSGASPVCIDNVIYFDGIGEKQDGTKFPHIYAVRDLGHEPELVWQKATGQPVLASLSKDPRGGLWYFPSYTPYLIRVNEKDGAIMEMLNLSILMGQEGYLPSSVMIQAGTAEQPVIIMSAAKLTIPYYIPCCGYIVAIDLNARNLLWKVPLDSVNGFGDWTASQYAVIHKVTETPVIVFPGNMSGAYGIGIPPVRMK